MVLISTGDQSGRPDTSGVDPDVAESYARRMFEAVLFCRFAVCKQLHLELNEDVALYVVANDLFRKMCKSKGMTRGTERFREYALD